MIPFDPATHDFLLTFHSNHLRFRDKWRYPSKIANFPTRVSPPLKGSLWNWVSVQGVKKAPMMRLPDGWKSIKI